MYRDFKIMAFQMILDFSNELEIDPAELLMQYDFTEEETEDFYNWCNFINKQ